jgi:hypothetical protein
MQVRGDEMALDCIVNAGPTPLHAVVPSTTRCIVYRIPKPSYCYFFLDYFRAP